MEDLEIKEIWGLDMLSKIKSILRVYSYLLIISITLAGVYQSFHMHEVNFAVTNEDPEYFQSFIRIEINNQEVFNINKITSHYAGIFTKYLRFGPHKIEIYIDDVSVYRSHFWVVGTQYIYVESWPSQCDSSTFLPCIWITNTSALYIDSFYL